MRRELSEWPAIARRFRGRRGRRCAGAAALAILLAACLAGGRTAARGRPDAAEYRHAADVYVRQREYGKAVKAFRQAAAIYRRIGDVNAAEVLEGLAQRYDSDLLLFYQRLARGDRLRSSYTGRRLEPVYGAYIGAFIDREDGLSQGYLDENSQYHKDSGEFNRRIGRDHAVFFMYMRYGRRFPMRWAEHLRRNHAAAQLVLSPESLAEVQDDGYLHAFARQAGRSGIPLFLRFAGEMNGDWVPYHGDPALYIEKFRLVARVFHEETRNVAMVWCVNDVPEHEITKYYPGEASVDWVGVNFYSVLYNNDDLSHPAWWRNPADSLRFVYRTYAARHPLMIGEYAATHMGRADMRRRPDFAITKIGQLYSALPRLYPRVKAVHWFSMNNLKHAMPGRQLNNYALLDDPSIAAHYASMVSSPYFLERVSLDEPALAGAEIARLTDGAVLSGAVTLSAWARSYEENPAVVFYVGDRKVSLSVGPGAHEWILDTRTLPAGPALIRAQVLDSRGKVVCKRAVRVRIGRAASAASALTLPR